jgi:hypothetical protein
MCEMVCIGGGLGLRRLRLARAICRDLLLGRAEERKITFKLRVAEAVNVSSFGRGSRLAMMSFLPMLRLGGCV